MRFRDHRFAATIPMWVSKCQPATIFRQLIIDGQKPLAVDRGHLFSTGNETPGFPPGYIPHFISVRAQKGRSVSLGDAGCSGRSFPGARFLCGGIICYRTLLEKPIPEEKMRVPGARKMANSSLRSYEKFSPARRRHRRIMRLGSDIDQIDTQEARSSTFINFLCGR